MADMIQTGILLLTATRIASAVPVAGSQDIERTRRGVIDEWKAGTQTCFRNTCGCPGEFPPNSYCTNKNAAIVSPWCNANANHCRRCNGEYCQYQSPAPPSLAPTLSPTNPLTDAPASLTAHPTPPPSFLPTTQEPSPSPTTSKTSPNTFAPTSPPPSTNYKNTDAYSIPIGFDRVGSGWCWGLSHTAYNFVRAANLEVCAAQCMAKKSCRSLVWMRSGRCWFYDGVATGASQDMGSTTCLRKVQSLNVTLTQADFNHGSYIITMPGRYTLASNIEFMPHDGTTVDDANVAGFLFPTADELAEGAKYGTKAFSLGFFAAIVVAADDVVIDLNGFTLSQSPEHALIQRFFSLIELANSPFPPFAGPADFGDETIAANDVVIRNGMLGRSSHHGIHGNSNCGVVLEDLVITDFEVAGVSLNAVDGLILANVQIQDSRIDIPVSGRWSGAINMLRLIDLNLGAAAVAVLPSLGEAASALRESVTRTVNAVLIDGTDAVIDDLYASQTGGLPDGSLLAGLVVHPQLNVGAHWGGDQGASNVDIKGLTVKNLHGIPTEVAVLMLSARDEDDHDGQGSLAYSGQHVRDNFGSVLDVDRVVGSDGRYVANPLSDAQMEMGRLKLACEAIPESEPACQNMALIERINFPTSVLDWAADGGIWDKVMSTGYTLKGGHDLMFHRNKGVIAVKIDGVTNVDLREVVISVIENHATNQHRTHRALLEGYRGHNTRAITLSAIKSGMGVVGNVSSLFAAVDGNTLMLEEPTACIDTNIQVIVPNATSRFSGPV